MDNCLFCGNSTNSDVSHFHGSTSAVCKSIPERRVNCRSDWQNFKIRVEKYKKSKFPQLREFALLVEDEVFNKNKPALDWNRQLIIARKLSSNMPLLHEVVQ